ncbi:MAG TPA: hypothetical protein VKP30_28540, partial [Polyangiaceae bacterium]|nr:hypothetical protein [Polyangiaceae bacterium]
MNAGVGACSGQEPTTQSGVGRAAAALVAGGTVNVGSAIGTEKPTPMPTTLGMYPALASDGDGYLSVSSIAGRIRGSRV